MFNPRKFDNFPGNMGTMGIVIAVFIALLVLSSLFSSGTAPMVILGGLGLFALWWLYDTYLKKTPKNNELSKYHNAVAQQKKNKSGKSGSTPDKSKVVYLDKFRHK